MAEENLKTTESAAAAVNLATRKGRYEVTAKRGVQVDGDRYEKGDVADLDGDAARALLNEGSIKEATE